MTERDTERDLLIVSVWRWDQQSMLAKSGHAHIILHSVRDLSLVVGTHFLLTGTWGNTGVKVAISRLQVSEATSWQRFDIQGSSR